jgi:hypothetical protein
MFIIDLYDRRRRGSATDAAVYIEELALSELDFEKVLLEAVDWGLSSLGESSKSAIYFHLRENFNVKREDIPSNMEAFVDALKGIFGPGAGFLEILIAKKLRERAQEALELQSCVSLTLTEYVASARKDLLLKSGAQP